MARAIIDIDALHDFIQSFGINAGAVREEKDHISVGFHDLRDIWSDKRYQAFEKSFNEMVVEVDAFLRYSEVYVDYLQRKARRADEYLNGA